MAVGMLAGRHRDAREGSFLVGERVWGRAVKKSRHREFAAALTTAATRCPKMYLAVELRVEGSKDEWKVVSSLR